MYKRTCDYLEQEILNILHASRRLFKDPQAG